MKNNLAPKHRHNEFGIFWVSNTTGAWGEFKTSEGYPWICGGFSEPRYIKRYKTREEAITAIMNINHMFAKDSRMQGLTLVVGIIETDVMFEYIDDEEKLEVQYKDITNKLNSEELDIILRYNNSQNKKKPIYNM